MNLPIDEQLDLLVDEELPEQQRQALLLWLDANPQRWRDLSIRFLQRQVENKAIRDLLATKTSVNASTCVTEEPREEPRMVMRGFDARYFATAAGLLFMAFSAFLFVRFAGKTAVETPYAGRGGSGSEVVTAPLPGSLWNVKGTQNVQVPVTSTDTPVLFPAGGGTLHQQTQRRTVIITPDGSHNALIIPVTNLQYQ